MRKTTAAALLLGSIAAPAQANGLGEDRPFQFRSPAEIQVRMNALDLMERKKGNYYGQWTATHNYTTFQTFNAGNMVNVTTGGTTSSTGGGGVPVGTPLNLTQTNNATNTTNNTGAQPSR